MPPLSLYVHIPWCIQKCPYCDFNSHAVKDGIPESRYIDALLEDLAQDLEHFGETRPLTTIFIGGGTPSLFSPDSINRLLSGINKRLAFSDALEITLEANPGTFESAKFAEFRALGINRLSIGIQSFSDRFLTRLGRVHSASEAIRAVEIAHQAGFDNFNLDLMFGLPGAQSSDSEYDITTAIKLKPKHISFYQLTLEPNTYFYQFPPKLPDDESIFNTQLACQQFLAQTGFEQYEISAYSQPDWVCKHNLNYWQFGDYLGIGAGAHGKLSLETPGKIMRYYKTKHPEPYLQSRQRWASAIAISDLPLEFIMNQLRLKQGFSLDSYSARTGLPVETLEPALSTCVDQDLLVKDGTRYACSPQGWLFLDSILAKFLP